MAIDPNILAEINADPEIRAATVDGWGHPLTESTNHDVSLALMKIFSKYGRIPVSLKHGQWVEDNGESWVDKAFQYGIPAAIGGVVAGPALAGLFGGHGGAAAAASSLPAHLGGAAGGVGGGVGGGSAAAGLAHSLLSPEFLGSAAYGALGFFNNRANNAMQQRQFDAMQRQRTGEGLAGADAAQADDLRARQQSYMNTFQMDPVAQQKDLFRAGAMRSLAQHGPSHIGPGFQSTLDFSEPASQFLNDEALGQNAAAFYGAAGSINPYAPARNLSAMGLPGTYQNQMQGQVDESRNLLEALQRQRRADLLGGISGGTGSSGFQTDDYFSRKRVG